MTSIICPEGSHTTTVTGANIYRKHSVTPGVECEYSRSRRNLVKEETARNNWNS